MFFRIFCVSFLISIMFNWLELYKVKSVSVRYTHTHTHTGLKLCICSIRSSQLTTAGKWLQ